MQDFYMGKVYISERDHRPIALCPKSTLLFRVGDRDRRIRRIAFDFVTFCLVYRITSTFALFHLQDTSDDK